jgi:hypothetical protein
VTVLPLGQTECDLIDRLSLPDRLLPATDLLSSASVTEGYLTHRASTIGAPPVTENTRFCTIPTDDMLTPLSRHCPSHQFKSPVGRPVASTMSADHSQSTTVRPTDQLLILHIRQEASRFSELILCIRQEASRFRELNLRTVMKIHGFASSSSVSVKKMRGFASSAPNPSVDSLRSCHHTQHTLCWHRR